jgi:YVTN family beta-propeller protein
MQPRVTHDGRARSGLRALALIGVGAMMATACTGGAGGGDAGSRVELPVPGMANGSGETTGALLRIDQVTNKVAAQTYAVGKDPTAVAVGEGSVWVANADDNSILRLDPGTGRVQATIVVGHKPRAIAIGGGVPGVWVNALNGVWKIDPLSNDAVLMEDLGEPSAAVAAGEGSVWVTLLLSGLGKVDPASGLLDRDFVVGHILCSRCPPADHRGGPSTGDHQRGAAPSVAAGLGSVWAVGSPAPGPEPSSVWRIDPSTGSSTPILVPFPLVGVAVGENAIWAVGRNGEVARVDPATNDVVKFIGTAIGATQVAVGLEAVWVLNPTLGTVTRIDPGTSGVVATIDVGKGTTALAVGEGSVWVTRRTFTMSG